MGPAHIKTIQTSVRDCMPSLHLAWALLLWIYSGRWLRIPMLIFAVLTAAATVGLGEHYAIDLVAALPFTWAVCAVAQRVKKAGDVKMRAHTEQSAAPLVPS